MIAKDLQYLGKFQEFSNRVPNDVHPLEWVNPIAQIIV